MSKKSLKLSGILVTTVLLHGIAQVSSAQAAIIASFEVQAPRTQTSQLGQGDGNSSSVVFTQTFNSVPVNTVTRNYAWTDSTYSGNPSGTIGTYNQVYGRPADQYGGASANANGIGSGTRYVTVQQSLGNLSYSTLFLNEGQKYFGLWWSAGDANNILSFYDQNNAPIGQFTSKSVIDAINALPAATRSLYFGNPVTVNALGNTTQNTGEPYAYLNFFATGTSLIKTVVITNTGGTGFESDNHSIASSYTNIRGQQLTPAPLSTVGQPNVPLGVPEPLTIAGAAVALGLGAFFKSKIRKNGHIS